jgi:hypothetical protein
MDNQSLRAKLAKLLRLQESPNPHEAANAAAKVEELCREHGLSVEEVDSDFDADKDEALLAELNTGKKTVNHADVQLISCVVDYFNGHLVLGSKQGHRTWNIFATKGNHAQIGLYHQYLLECREKALQGEDCPSWESPRSFNASFRLGFAAAVRRRLRDLKEQRDTEAAAGKLSAAPGLVPMPRPQMELALAQGLARSTFPNTGKLAQSRVRSYSGLEAGRAAGEKVGLQKQATGSNAKSLGAGR